MNDRLDVVLPYGGTSGHAPDSASTERAHRRDRDGRTATVQHSTLEALRRAGERGIIYTELVELLNEPANVANPALSVLHKEGIIAKLAEKRDTCGIYVLPEHINGRATVPHGGMNYDRWQRIGVANGWLIVE